MQIQKGQFSLASAFISDGDFSIPSQMNISLELLQYLFDQFFLAFMQQRLMISKTLFHLYVQWEFQFCFPIGRDHFLNEHSYFHAYIHMFVYVLPDMTLMRMAIVCISAQMRMRICYGVILEGTADMSSFCLGARSQQ